jgi:hypothetical protein
MAYEEGFRRVNFVARLVLFVGVAMLAVAIIGAAAASVLSMHLYAMAPLLFLLGLIGFYLSALGGILWACLWIVEGFVREPKVPQR